MTEDYQPPTSRNRGNPEQDTATLPRVTVPPSAAGSAAPAGSSAPGSAVPAGPRGANPGSSDGWSAVSRSDAPPAGRPDLSSGRPPAGYPAGPADPRGVDPRAADPRNAGSPADASGLGARLSAAASTVAAGATTAAVNAKSAIKTAANEAENRAGRPVTGRGRGRQPRRARLTLSHINVYSVFKFSCVLAIALFFVWLIMVGVLYGILDVSGVFDRVNNAVHQISGDDKSGNVVTGPVVFGFAIIIGVVNIVLFIALATVGAMVYNLCADLVGGAEVTLSEREEPSSQPRPARFGAVRGQPVSFNTAPRAHHGPIAQTVRALP